ncbi:efflux RND transporter permease subunit, partial [Enterococcus faecium]
IDAPAGTVSGGGRRFNLDAGGAYRSLDAIRAIPLRASDGRLVRVGDVATVSWGIAEQLHLARFNGHRALFVTVKQKDEVDASTLRKALTE